MTTAVKNNPKLWEKSKKEAIKKFGKHSARAMQWAVRYYKSHGGTYSGKKKSSNSLSRWSKQKWRTYNGKKSEGKLRYLPDKAWDNLSKDQIRRTNTAKLKGYKKGKQFVQQPKDVAKISKQYRSRKPVKKSRKRLSTKRRSRSFGSTKK